MDRDQSKIDLNQWSPRWNTSIASESNRNRLKANSFSSTWCTKSASSSEYSTTERRDRDADAQKRLTKLTRYQAWKEYRHWSRHAARNNPTAQCTFKVLLVLGILQFTMFITLRCALHRCLSRDICRWKLLVKLSQKHTRSSTSRGNLAELKSQRQQEARGWPQEVPLALPPLTNCMRKATTLEKQHRLTQKSHR